MEREGENHLGPPDEPVVSVVPADEPDAPEYHTDVEQAQIGEFAHDFGQRMFGGGEQRNEARTILDESLASSLVFNIAEQQLQKENQGTSIEQADPMARLQAIQTAKQRLQQASGLYGIFGDSTNQSSQRIQDYQREGLDKYANELTSIRLIRNLLGVGGDYQTNLRWQLGMGENEFGLLSDGNKAWLTKHLNEINMIELARGHDDEAQRAGRSGRMFVDNKAPAWLSRLMTMNGFELADERLLSPESDGTKEEFKLGKGLLLPKDMDEDAKEKYVLAFGQYQQLFGEKNIAARQNLNEREEETLANIESLLAEYETAAQLDRSQPTHKQAVERAQQQLDQEKSDLNEARLALIDEQRRLDGAKWYNRGKRTKDVEDQQAYIRSLEENIGKLTNNVDVAKTTHEQAQGAWRRKEEIARNMQNQGFSDDAQVTKIKLDERKQRPKY